MRKLQLGTTGKHTMSTACVTVAFPRGPRDEALRLDLDLDRLVRLDDFPRRGASSPRGREVSLVGEGPSIASSSSSSRSSSSSSKSSPAFDIH